MLCVSVASAVDDMIDGFPSAPRPAAAFHVGVDRTSVGRSGGDPDVELRKVLSGKIQGDEHRLLISAEPHISEDIVVGVVGIDPAETVEGIVGFPECVGIGIIVVQFPDEALQFAVLLIVQQQPVQFPLLIPFDKLTEFSAHEGELLAGVGEHVGIEDPELGKFVLVFAGHFVQQGFLPVHHLVM